MNGAEQAWIESARQEIEGALYASCADAHPAALLEIVRYPLKTGGKRFRPLLCLAAFEGVGGPPERRPLALACAVALEMIHTFSLVHDDLPCMDDDDTRRGLPTVHALHGEAIGLLAGDALIAEAFVALADAGAPPALVAELGRATGAAGMVGGQYLDITARPDWGLDALTDLHRRKTGALIRAAARMGALSAGADPAQLAALTAYGEAVGLAFQLQDDVLDADQDAAPDGPPSFVKLLGLDATRRRALEEADRAAAAVAHLPAPAALDALARLTVDRAI